jgi:hypothetical protein
MSLLSRNTTKPLSPMYTHLSVLPASEKMTARVRDATVSSSTRVVWADVRSRRHSHQLLELVVHEPPTAGERGGVHTLAAAPADVLRYTDDAGAGVHEMRVLGVVWYVIYYNISKYGRIY